MEQIYTKPASIQNDPRNEIANLYLHPPNDKIKLEEMEELATTRMNFLKNLDSLSLKLQKNSDEFKSEFRKLDNEYIKNIQKRFGDKYRKFDEIGHYLLRLAFAKIVAQRNWFVALESEVLKQRLKRESDKTVKNFLTSTKIQYQIVNSSELGNIDNTKSDYYQFNFEDVPDLVRMRQVPLKNGFAYLGSEQLTPIILQFFKQELTTEIEKIAGKISRIDEDARVINSLAKIVSMHENRTYDCKNAAVDKISVDNIDFICDTSFPPCMSTIHNYLKKHHHLKHKGRIQYGLFLKGLGLTLEESLDFWRKKFSLVPSDKFDKLYSYYIRYNYGQEGKRQDFSSMSCMKVIMSDQTAIGEIHGCPFKQFDAKNLEKMLIDSKISDRSEIMDLASSHHYQIACARFFEITHNKPKNTISITHPVEYYQLSQLVHQGKPTENANIE